MGIFFFILYQFWVGNSFYCISEILGSKHFLVTLEMRIETWNIIPFHFMGIYNNLKYLPVICSIKYLKIIIFTTYITLEFFSVVVIRNCDISTEIDLCLDMVIFKILIEHIKYLGMLYIPHEMKRVDVSSFYTYLQSYQKVFKAQKIWYTVKWVTPQN